MEKTFEHDNLKVTYIGSQNNGIDGSDEYVQVDSLDGTHIKPEQIDDLFWAWWGHHTRQEAGGYFCTSYGVYFHQYGNDRAVLCIHHRYDV